MRHQTFEKQKSLDELIGEYSATSQQKAAVNFKEAEFCALADYFGGIHNWSKAGTVLTDGLTRHPSSSELYLRKLELLLQNRQLGEAARLANLAATNFPDDDERRFLYRAEAYCEHGNLDAAFEAIRKFGAARQTRMHSRPQTAFPDLAEFMTNMEPMIFRLQQHLLEQPDDLAAFEKLHILVEATGLFEESIRFHEAFLDCFPRSSWAWLNLGCARAETGEYDDALEWMELSYLIDPGFRPGFEAFSALAFRLEEYALAIRGYHEMAESIPPDSQYFVRLGECHEKQGQIQLAIATYCKAIDLDSANSEAFFRLGECSVLKKDDVRAIDFFEKAIRLNGKMGGYHASIAKAHARLGHIAEAVNHFLQATEFAPDESKYWVQTAGFLLARKRWKRTLDLLDEADCHCPEASELNYCRAACHLLMDDRNEGLEWLDAALETDFETHDSLFELAPALLKDAEVLARIAQFQNR